jgi:hypothetical protein
MCGEEGIGHRAADQQRVHPFEEVLDDLEFSRHLGAAEDGDEGSRRRREHGAEVSQFGCQQQPGRRVWQMPHNARGRRVCAMRRAEGVVDVAVGWRGKRLGERRVVGRLTGVKS